MRLVIILILILSTQAFAGKVIHKKSGDYLNLECKFVDDNGACAEYVFIKKQNGEYAMASVLSQDLFELHYAQYRYCAHSKICGFDLKEDYSIFAGVWGGFWLVSDIAETINFKPSKYLFYVGGGVTALGVGLVVDIVRIPLNLGKAVVSIFSKKKYNKNMKTLYTEGKKRRTSKKKLAYLFELYKNLDWR